MYELEPVIMVLALLYHRTKQSVPNLDDGPNGYEYQIREQKER